MKIMDFVIFPDFSLLDIHPTLDLPYIAISFYLVQVLFFYARLLEYSYL